MMAQTANIGPLDLTPTGHEAYIVSEANSDVTNALAKLGEFRKDSTGPGAEILDIVAAEIRRTGDPTAVTDQVLTLMGNAARTECETHTWCTGTGEHDAHMGATIDIPAPDPQEKPYLGAYLIDLGGGAVAGLDAGTWQDLDSAGLRAEAAKIRAHCDRLDALADQLAAIEASK
ncbi:hypothetical protein J7E87_19915 [Streptomyces sp. ISL-1]|uniref:hypothetical protein n=1 Tax=Streptomyces sp. ISL-1 TaxID=2817657 RepID=UPI001BE7C04D|nr:hypothetical protein [Streptomyces sp. ISL-1]MBT2391637.1 hypothetical protein [Streptomyces sp. ISL-1]